MRPQPRGDRADDEHEPQEDSRELSREDAQSAVSRVLSVVARDPDDEDQQAGEEVDAGVVLVEEREAEQAARGHAECERPPLASALARRRRGGVRREQAGRDGERDERFGLAAHPHAAQALERRIAQEQEQEGRGLAGSGPSGDPPPERDEQQRHHRRRQEIGCGDDRVVMPRGEHGGVGQVNAGRFLIPGVPVRHFALQDRLPDVGVDPLVTPGGLDDRRQAHDQQSGGRGRERPLHQREPCGSVRRRPPACGSSWRRPLACDPSCVVAATMRGSVP